MQQTLLVTGGAGFVGSSLALRLKAARPDARVLAFDNLKRRGSELLLEEYRTLHGLRCVVNRCGVITGPWQMGKVDQGVVVLWAARHEFGGALQYIGYGGTGRQVRDLLHVDDLGDLVESQLAQLDEMDGRAFDIGAVPENRSQDVPVYRSDCRALEVCGSRKVRPAFLSILGAHRRVPRSS